MTKASFSNDLKVDSGTGISVQTCAVYHLEKEKHLFFVGLFPTVISFQRLYMIIYMYIV